MKIPPAIEPIVQDLPALRDAMREFRELVISNAVFLSEIPAPTGGETARAKFFSDRLIEAQLQNISIDEKGNAVGIVPGTKGDRNILIAAHLDTVFDATTDHTVTVGVERIHGAGIADNSLGAAVTAALPTILQRLGIQLESNLVLLGAAHSLGEGDIGGMRFFLDHSGLDFDAGICVEGVHIGRLSYSSLGMLRGEIICRVATETDWERYGGSGAIVNLTNIIQSILQIPTPRAPKTSVILGSVSSGKTYNNPPTKAVLRFELRSEQAGQVSRIRERIEEIIKEVNARTQTRNELKELATRRPGSIDFSHPLVRSARAIMEALDLKPKIAPSVGELSALIDKEIPGITVGISKGHNVHEPEEAVEIEPLFSGLAQLLGIIQAIDAGVCETP